MSIIDSNARWADEDKAMQAYLDQQDAEMAEVYDNEVYPTPAQEKVMEAQEHVAGLEEALERAQKYLEEALEELAEDEGTLGQTAGTSTITIQQEPAQQTTQVAPESAPEASGHWDPGEAYDAILGHLCGSSIDEDE